MIVDSTSLSNLADRMAESFDKFKEYEHRAEEIFYGLSRSSSEWCHVNASMQDVITSLYNIRDKGINLASCLKACAEAYEDTENDIVDYYATHGQRILKFVETGEVQKKKKKSKVDKIFDIVHTTLDVVGYIPALGDIADLVNGVVYLAEGDIVNAAISASAAIPFCDGVSGVRVAKNVTSALGEGLAKKATKELAEEVTEHAVKEVTEEVVEHAVKEGAEEAVEHTVKEVTEEVVEHTVKEVAEEAGENTVKEVTEEAVEHTVKEAAEESVEKTTKKVGEEVQEEATDTAVKQTKEEAAENTVKDVDEKVTDQTVNNTEDHATSTTVNDINESSVDSEVHKERARESDLDQDIKSGSNSANKIGNSDKVVHSYTRDEIINSLDGVTQKSTEIANSIQNGKIKINVLGDELFESYLGCSSDTMAMQVGNQIYVRSSSATLFSDVVHEGVHAMDFINGVDESVISSWSGETSAYNAERLFQLESGMPVQFESEEDMMVHIWSNYKK